MYLGTKSINKDKALRTKIYECFHIVVCDVKFKFIIIHCIIYSANTYKWCNKKKEYEGINDIKIKRRIFFKGLLNAEYEIYKNKCT